VPSDAEESDIDDFMPVDDSDEDHFTTSEDEESLSSATPSVLDMSSDQTLAHAAEMSNNHLTSDGSARSAPKSAPEDDAVVDTTQDADAKQKKSRAKPETNMLNLNAGMKKEIDLTLPPPSNTNDRVGDG
jgi:hypothetical protein